MWFKKNYSWNCRKRIEKSVRKIAWVVTWRMSWHCQGKRRADLWCFVVYRSKLLLSGKEESWGLGFCCRQDPLTVSGKEESWALILLQGLMQNSEIYGGCCRTKQQSWQNFLTCVFLQDGRHFQHIPISTIKFSNTVQHEYKNFPKCYSTHCGILEHFTAFIEELP